MRTQPAPGLPHDAKAIPARPRRGRPLDAVKRERIIAAATEAFLEFGFNAASMDLVAQRAMVSKVTVYAHFKSKEALFGSIIDGLAGGLVARINRFALGDMAPEPALRQFGRMYLELALAASSLALHRVVIAESARVPALGRLIYQNGPVQIVGSLADFLARQKELRLADARLAAEQFLGMVLGHSQLRLLLNARPAAHVRADIEKTVDHAVEIFLKGALSSTSRRAPRRDARLRARVN
jgi:TetR/AcrR family transcriptional repressor of mexJK operon